MADPFSLALMGISMVGAFASAGMQAAGARSQAEAQQEEAARQAKEANRIAAEQKGDRARQADADMATLKVLQGEKGGLGSNTFFRQSLDLGYTAGLDLSRIESNRKNTVEALKQGAAVAGAQAGSVATTSLIGAGISTVSSGLQIGASAYKEATITELLKNRTP